MAGFPADVAWVDVLPTPTGFLPALRRITAGASATAGVESGRIFASTFADAVAAATTKLSAAQKRAADAAGVLSVAQARLNEVQASATASAARMAAAEEAVQKAQRNVALQADAVATAQSKLSRVTAEQAAASQISATKQGVLTGAMGGVTGASGRLGTAIGGVNKAYSLMFAAFTLTLPIIPFIAATKAAGDFQSLLVKLVTTAGESNSNLKLVGDGILNLAGKVGIGANDLARGMYIIESAGFHGASGLLVLKAAAEGARQEQADLGDVANAVSTILHDYGKPATEAATVTSQLITAVGHGKTTFQDFTASLHSVTPVASKVGLTLQDVAATLAAMTLSGETADQATENMRNAILTLQKPSQGMISELAQLGIQAADLQRMLADPHIGLSGTLQNISQAILQHMGPAGTVMLDALNKSTLGAQGLQQMLGTMHGRLLDLSKGLLAGSVGISDYRKDVRALGGQAGASGLQFLGLYQQSDGFNQILKAGGPTVQTYQQALQRATGTQATYTVALQTTRENAGPLATTLGLVANAAATGKGDIQGWSEVQGTFNQKMAEAHATVGVLAIKLGTTLLPALSAFLGWVTQHAIPGLESFGHSMADLVHSTGFQEFLGSVTGLIGSLVGSVARLVTEFSKSGGLHDVLVLVGVAGGVMLRTLEGVATIAARVLGTLVDWFGKLPGPLQVVVAGFVALKIAMAAGWLDSFAIRGLYVVSALKAMGAAAVAMAGEMVAAYRAAAAASAFSASVEGESAAVSRITGSISGLGAAAGVAARGGLTALKSGLGGIVNLLGGPWGVAFLGAGAIIGTIIHQVQAHNQAVKDATNAVTGWYKAIGQGGQPALQAYDNLRGKEEELKTAQDKLTTAQEQAAQVSQGASRAGANYNGVVNEQKQRVADLTSELQKGQQAYRDYFNALSPLQQATERTGQAQTALEVAIRNTGPTSEATARAAGAYQTALANQNTVQTNLNNAEQTHLQRLQAIANQELAGINSSLAAQQAQHQLNSAVEQYNKDAADGTHNTDDLAAASNALAQQAYGAAQASAQAAVDQGKANGATDLGTIANQAMLKSLQDSAAHITGPGHDALESMISTLQSATVTNDNLSGAVSKMGLNVVGTWANNTAVLKGATDAEIKDLNDLGYVTTHLPNGNVAVTANTKPAQQSIIDLLNYARTQSILYRALLPDLNGSASGSGRPGLATGGWVHGPGTTTSDSIPVNLSNREFVVNAAAAQEHAPLLEAINAGMAAGGWVMPQLLSAGGWVGLSPDGTWPVGGATVPVSWDLSAERARIDKYFTMLKAQAAAVAAAASAVGSVGGAARWTNVVNQALGMVGQSTGLNATVLRRMNQESGGNPYAINRTDSNWKRGTPSVGLMQVIGPTYRAYHDGRRDVGPYAYGTSEDPLSNILASFHYAIARYGSLPTAFNRAGGYDNGGLWPSGTAGINTTGQDERVLSPPQDTYFRRFVDATSTGTGAGTPIWHFYLGDREITDLVDARMEVRNDRLGRNLRSAQ